MDNTRTAATKVLGNLHVDQERTSGAATQLLGTSSAQQRMAPMTREQAVKMVRRLLAGYPNLTAHDPEGYMAAMVQVMGEYPLWAGERTIIKVDEQNAQFPPSDRTLRQWLDEAVRPFRYSAEWSARTVKQLAGREPDAPTATREPQGEVFTNFEKALAAHGRPFGPFEAGRQLVYDATPFRRRRTWMDGVGRENS